MNRPALIAALLTGYVLGIIGSQAGCVVPHAHVMYSAASGAALVCDVIAGVIKRCQEAPQGTTPKVEDESLNPEHSRP
jgi:hypothetical protein